MLGPWHGRRRDRATGGNGWLSDNCNAGPEPLREFHRQPFDYAYQMVSSGGMLLYGSNADCKLRAGCPIGPCAIDVFTSGPIRFSPAIWKSRVYLPSDDGFLYCLRLESGSLLWKRRIGPTDDLVIGNDRIISRWPRRSGALVKDGVVYMTAGMSMAFISRHRMP